MCMCGGYELYVIEALYRVMLSWTLILCLILTNLIFLFIKDDIILNTPNGQNYQ